MGSHQGILQSYTSCIALILPTADLSSWCLINTLLCIGQSTESLSTGLDLNLTSDLKYGRRAQEYVAIYHSEQGIYEHWRLSLNLASSLEYPHHRLYEHWAIFILSVGLLKNSEKPHRAQIIRCDVSVGAASTKSMSTGLSPKLSSYLQDNINVVNRATARAQT